MKGLFLIGPFADPLRQCLYAVKPWFDRWTRNLVYLYLVGSPEQPDDVLKKVFKRYGLEPAALEASWKAAASKRGGCVDRATCSEEDRLTEALDIDLEDLPVLLLFTGGYSQPLVVRLPREAWAADLRRQELVRLLRLHLSDDKVNELRGAADAVRSDAPFLARFREAFVFMVQSLNTQIEQLAVLPSIDDLSSNEKAILRAIVSATPKRLVTRIIAERVDRSGSSIGKDLVSLRKKGLVENQRRKGYSPTAEGLKQARALGL